MSQERPRSLYEDKKRFALPPSPRGIASLMDLNTEPDFTASQDTLVVGWETDPAITREYVPRPLEVDGSGLMYLMTVRRWSYTGRNRTEFISPERHTQLESFLKIPCTLDGKPYVFLSFSWGDRDRMVTAGRHIGLFHKFARLQMTQFHPFHPVWNGPHEGARINVIVENIGTVVRASGVLERPMRADDAIPIGITPAQQIPYLGHRYIYDTCAGKPLKNDLVAQLGADRETSPIWSGRGEIAFFDAENEEVRQFEPRRMVGAWWYHSRYRRGRNVSKVVYDFGEVDPYEARAS